MDFLVVAKDGSPTDWYKTIGLVPKKVHDRWSDGRTCDPPRVIADLSEMEAASILAHDFVKNVEPRNPLSKEDMAKKINELYRDGSELGTKAADALLDLMSHLDKVTKERNGG